jgi:hypothetical protein
MPVDYQQVHERIKQIGAGARAHDLQLQKLRSDTRAWLTQNARELEALRAKVDSARAADAKVRCALPLAEPLDSHIPAPRAPSGVTLIAADGSQIEPDRHASALFSVINIGVVVFKPGSGAAPEIQTTTDLKYGDELYGEHGGMLDQESISLGRDLAERRKLLDVALLHPKPVITFTDGPIELWGAEGSAQEDYRRNREIHLSTLSQLQAAEKITAGYVEKPTGDLVVRLLEISQLTAEQMKNVRDAHRLRGVTDRWLLGEAGRPLLGHGERSAIFILQSSSRLHYAGPLEIRFFYLNVGSEKHPWIVRVEVPAWVADNAQSVGLLQACLMEQCAIMGSRPYPYILHRAHETALVKHDEQEQIEQMLDQELRGQGVEVGEASYKQSAKDLPGRA